MCIIYNYYIHINTKINQLNRLKRNKVSHLPKHTFLIISGNDITIIKWHDWVFQKYLEYLNSFTIITFTSTQKINNVWILHKHKVCHFAKQHFGSLLENEVKLDLRVKNVTTRDQFNHTQYRERMLCAYTIRIIACKWYIRLRKHLPVVCILITPPKWICKKIWCVKI